MRYDNTVIILYQIVTGCYSKVVHLKALIPFFGMGLSFIRKFQAIEIAGIDVRREICEK